MIEFIFDRDVNILGKGENAGFQDFLLFPKYFQKPSSAGFLKVGIVLSRVEREKKKGTIRLYCP